MDYLDQMRLLQEQKRPFVLATVVRIEKPTSAKPGAKAIITEDGTLVGWIGGSCAEPSVKQEAAKALQDGQPRLLRLCPVEKMGRDPQAGVTELKLTCMSGGVLEIYIEPYLPQPSLLLIGHQPVIASLAALGKVLDYSVTVVGDGVSGERFPAADAVIAGLDFGHLEITPRTYVIVASHNNYDEPALEAVLPSQAAYVGLVASRKRAESVREYLRQDGLPEEIIARLKNPAGLDIGAITPAEIALSILAEIVESRRRGMPVESLPPSAVEEIPETALDPVCGMTVDVATARFTAGYQGETYYFCSAHCQRAFEKAPQEYLQVETEAGGEIEAAPAPSGQSRKAG